MLNTENIIPQLTRTVNKIAGGHYDYSNHLFEWTKDGASSPEFGELAEAIGILAVKVEAREFHLEQVIEDLKHKKALLEEESRTRHIFTVIFSMATIALCFYTLILAVTRDIEEIIRTSEQIRQYLNYGLMLFLAAVMLFGTRTAGRPMADFGLSTKNWLVSIRDGIFYTIPWLVLITLVKWWMVHFLPSFQGKAVFEFSSYPFTAYLIYFVVLSFQEFFARGMMQGPMEHCLVGKNSKWLAIVMSSIIFGVYHLHYSIPMAAVSAIAGIQFGSLYSRHQTLIAPIVSHLLVGSWILGPLGFIPYILQR
ncbi:MAG TPA: CPBP family intramembrane glutamic endopeptidase [Thermodesulfobacteriota bacterium]|nr:CPBP family intramembrane glutamic endopeptidase [Thermodesulfobacteriota bacterium]